MENVATTLHAMGQPKPIVLIAFSEPEPVPFFDYNMLSLTAKLNHVATVRKLSDPREVEASFLTEPWPEAILVYHDALGLPQNKDAADSIFAYICFGGRVIVLASFVMHRREGASATALALSQAFKEMVVPWRIADFVGCCNVLSSAAAAAQQSVGINLCPGYCAYSALGLDSVDAEDIWYTSYAHDDSRDVGNSEMHHIGEGKECRPAIALTTVGLGSFGFVGDLTYMSSSSVDTILELCLSNRDMFL